MIANQWQVLISCPAHHTSKVSNLNINTLWYSGLDYRGWNDGQGCQMCFSTHTRKHTLTHYNSVFWELSAESCLLDVL